MRLPQLDVIIVCSADDKGAAQELCDWLGSPVRSGWKRTNLSEYAAECKCLPQSVVVYTGIPLNNEVAKIKLKRWL